MITREKLIGWKHCYSVSDFANICGIIFSSRTKLSVAEFLELPTTIFRNPGDKFWVVSSCLPNTQLHKISIWCAKKVLHIFEKEYPDDNRPRNAITTKEKWLQGEATDIEIDAAGDAAWAAGDAAWAAGDAAGAAAWAAAWAAGDAAGAAARAAARAAGDAAGAAARAAARAAAGAAARAAGDAAGAAAWAAAGDAAWAAFYEELYNYITKEITNEQA